MKNKKLIIIFGVLGIIIIGIIILLIINNSNSNKVIEEDKHPKFKIEAYSIYENDEGLSYPIFNINSIELDRLNKKIISHNEESYGFKERNEKSNYYKYDVDEIDSYINILESHVQGKDDSHNKYVYYTVSIEKGKILNNEEVLNIYHYNKEELWNKVKDLIEKEKYIKVDDFTELNIAPYYDNYIMIVLHKETSDNLFVYNGNDLLLKR